MFNSELSQSEISGKPHVTFNSSSCKSPNHDPNEIILPEKKITKEAHSLMDLLKENLTSEMYHALLNILDSPYYIIKIHLAVFVLVSYALSSYTTITLFFSYLNFGVTTTSRTLHETPVTFPKVTICNPNYFTSQHGLAILKQVNQLYLPDIDLFDSSQVSQLSAADTYGLMLTLYFVASGNTLKMNATEQKLLSHNLEEILLKCSYNYQPCSAADFSWSFDPTYGNCYSFNSGFNATGHAVELKQAYLAGESFGFLFQMYVNYYEELTLFNSVNGGQLRI